jgi:hypothetical protein
MSQLCNLSKTNFMTSLAPLTYYGYSGGKATILMESYSATPFWWKTHKAHFRTQAGLEGKLSWIVVARREAQRTALER